MKTHVQCKLADMHLSGIANPVLGENEGPLSWCRTQKGLAQVTQNTDCQGCRERWGAADKHVVTGSQPSLVVERPSAQRAQQLPDGPAGPSRPSCRAITTLFQSILLSMQLANPSQALPSCAAITVLPRTPCCQCSRQPLPKESLKARMLSLIAPLCTEVH